MSLPTPPVIPTAIVSKIDGVVGQARNAYNHLPGSERSIITLVAAVVIGVAVLKFVGSLIGRVVSIVIAVVIVYALWHYLPQLTGQFHA